MAAIPTIKKEHKTSGKVSNNNKMQKDYIQKMPMGKSYKSRKTWYAKISSEIWNGFSLQNEDKCALNGNFQGSLHKRSFSCTCKDFFSLSEFTKHTVCRGIGKSLYRYIPMIDLIIYHLQNFLNCEEVWWLKWLSSRFWIQRCWVQILANLVLRDPSLSFPILMQHTCNK